MEVPLIGKKPLGPIHTLISDGKGRVYLSDEINNRVLCLTEQGRLLWCHGVDSADPIRLRYPRGLALGRISTENAGLADCLAVCDSWNDRVVFLSLESGQIGEWRTAGDLPLREVSDIRYLENGWLLLDRGNQRLCWLELDGQLRTQIGSAGGPQTASNSKFSVFKSMAEKYASPIPKAFPPFNLLHHPSRIIGTPRQLLAVSESLGPSLKLIHDGFLYPLPLNRTCDTWLALDDFGFLGWEKADRVLVFFDLNGTESLRIPTNGVPVCADLGAGEWWEQQGQTLSRHSFVYEGKQKSAGIRQQLAAMDIASIDFAETEAVLDDYLGCLRRLDETLDGLQLKMEMVKSSFEILGSSALKWRVCLDGAGEIPDSSVPHIKSFVPRLKGSLNATFIALVANLDRLVLTGADFEAAPLWPAGKFLSDCYNLLEGVDRIFRPSHAGSRRTYGLKEVDRWQIDLNGGLHLGPRNLALTKNGTISISFNRSNAILEMDPGGRPVGQSILPTIPGAEAGGIGPNGIAWDEDDRLWLTYGSLKCAVIWDVSRNSIQVVNGFNVPFAICKGGPNEMLITDREDHSVIGISYEGHCKRLAGGRGRMPRQFINPGCLVEQPCAVWVVDHRNHRLQKLSLSGDFLSEFGGCGLEKGRLAVPLTAAAFPDGTLAISMWHLIRCLMLVSPEGEELGGVAIDFVPEGMLALEDKLLVADCDGNQIRVYERFV